MARKIRHGFWQCLPEAAMHVAMFLIAFWAPFANAEDPVKSAQGKTPLFYPALPDPPRLQLLLTLTGEHDIKPAVSSFAKFILGDDESNQTLSQPYGSAMHNGKLYVVDTGSAAVAIFDIPNKKFSYLSGSPNGQMRRPINIHIDSNGYKYVTDTGRDKVLVYDANDAFVAAFGKENQFRPTDIAISGNRLYVTDVLHHQIHVLDKNSGNTLFTFGKAGSGEGELYHPTNIALGPDNNLYVSETSNYRVQVFSPEGKFLRGFGSVGTSPGSFARPKGIAIDHEGRIYVADAAFENVQLFNNQGKLLTFFGQRGEPMERMHLPTGLSIDYDNVELFGKYADPKFQIEYLVMVTSQFGPNKVDIYGFGRMTGMNYPPDGGTADGTSH